LLIAPDDVLWHDVNVVLVYQVFRDVTGAVGQDRKHAGLLYCSIFIHYNRWSVDKALLHSGFLNFNIIFLPDGRLYFSSLDNSQD